jgi:hypothetical protein
MPDSPEIGSPYSFCAHVCLTAVHAWANKKQYNGDVAYFFESGHPSQSEANDIMNRLFQIPGMKEGHRYASHAFADKQKVRALQAADLIAWQWFTDRKRIIERKRKVSRKDCYELMHGQPYKTLHYDDHMLKKIAAIVLRNEYPMTFVE